MPRLQQIVADGASRLLRVAAPARGGEGAVLMVPSPLQPWTLIDLHPGASLVAALSDAGLDVFVLDWGRFGDADRHLAWDDLVARLTRMKRVARRAAGADVSLVGVSLGATLAAVAVARAPRGVTALASLVGPIDFGRGGVFARWTQRRHLDADVVAAAGNLPSWTLRAAVIVASPLHALRGFAALADPDPAARALARAVQSWAADGIPLPAAAYATWIGDFYQRNALVRGVHRVAGERVALAAITCPVMAVAAEDDAICPPSAALALTDHVGSAVRDTLRVPGGHVSGLVGPTAAGALYRPLGAWLRRYSERGRTAHAASSRGPSARGSSSVR